ncbi:MAG TPA: SusC/RagA family TonB-linked outer membrane protein [Longimicrobiales bacterium]
MTLRTCLRGLISAAGLLALWSAGPVEAQETGTVQGVVLDAATNRPLPGAQITIVGPNLTQITNDQGRYLILNVPAGQHTMRLELLGYNAITRDITVTAGQATTVNLTVEPEAIALGELVVTGVSGGAVERAKVPFSVSRVDADQMPVQAVNPLSQIQGKVPGANIAQISGRPGTAPAVILRGPTSINASGRSQEPLYIIDGIVLSSSIADINPADIQSVEIVKGAAASTLYGSRAASGVIQITTKRGTVDGVRFTARSEYGLNDIERDFGIARFHPFLLDETGTRFCVLDAYGSSNLCSRTIDYRAEQLRINNAPGDFALPTVGFPVDPGAVSAGPILRRSFLAGVWPGTTYNAVEQLVDPKPLSQNDFSMSGRIGSTTFFSSVGYTRQGGAIQGLEGYERLNGRINLGQRIGEQWNIELQSYISRADLDGTNQEEGGVGFFRLTRTPAIVDITQRDDLGRLFIRTNLGSGGTQNENPLYSFENTQREDVRWRYLIGGNLRYTPLTWLEADANFSVDRLNTNFRQFNNRGFRTTNNNPNTNNGLIFNGVNNTQSLNGSTGITLRSNLMDAVTSRITLRWLYEQENFDGRSLQGNLLRVADVDAAANATNIQNISSSKTETRQMSFSAGGFFDVLDRYTFDLAVRRDGNSRFGDEHRWQTYWRASGAWLAAREAWFPVDALSTFTLRASVGTAGNAPNYSAQYETYNIGSGGTLNAATLGNPLLRPEVQTEIEVGADLEFLERYGFSLTYANSLTKDQILPVPIAVATGFPTQWQNAGELRNQTWEASLSLPILRNTGGFNWTARANYTQNRTMVEKLNVPPFFIGTGLQATGDVFRVEEGMRYGTIFGRVFMRSCSQLPAAFQSQCGPGRAFQTNDEGWLVWVGDGNNPGMGITHNMWNAQLPASQGPYGLAMNWGMPILVRDTLNGTPLRLPIGNALPDYRVGFSNTVEFRRFSLYALVDAAYGRDIWNQGRHWSFLDFLGKEVDQGEKSVENAKPIGYYFRTGPWDGFQGLGGFYDALTPSNQMVEDASFVKLREVSASYNIGTVGNFGDWTVSVIGRNLKTWSDYRGFDPEVGIGSSGGQSGSGLINAIDAFTFPSLRTFSFVLSTTF